jgi:hypothetical protein
MEGKQMQREQVIDEVLSARTLDECDKAKKLIIAWMQEHPRDFGILDAGEQIAMLLDGYSQEAPLSRPVA